MSSVWDDPEAEEVTPLPEFAEHSLENTLPAEKLETMALEVLERIAREIIPEMAERVIRETLPEIAERLVREEIKKIEQESDV